MTPTNIRKTYISVMLARNIDIWVIAKIVGHKDTKQITETYGYLIQEKEELESDLIRVVFKKMNRLTKTKETLLKQRFSIYMYAPCKYIRIYSTQRLLIFCSFHAL